MASILGSRGPSQELSMHNIVKKIASDLFIYNDSLLAFTDLGETG